MSSGKETRSIFLAGVHHAYAQTDGTYAWPNSREGDLLKQGMREVEHLRAELAAAIKQRDEARDTAAAIHKRNWYEAKTEYGTELGKVRAELAEMRQQRDEARQEVCRYWALRSVAVLGVYRSAIDFAADRGWDCYAQQEGGGA